MKRPMVSLVLGWALGLASPGWGVDGDLRKGLPESLVQPRWRTGLSVLTARPVDGEAWVSVKDPSIVRAGDRWHLFVTVRGTRRSHAIKHLAFDDWADAERAPRRILKCHAGYFCAPQVFRYRPQGKWS